MFFLSGMAIFEKKNVILRFERRYILETYLQIGPTDVLCVLFGAKLDPANDEKQKREFKRNRNHFDKP